MKKTTLNFKALCNPDEAYTANEWIMEFKIHLKFTDFFFSKLVRSVFHASCSKAERGEKIRTHAFMLPKYIRTILNVTDEAGI